jgi:hypothetical protein
LVRALHHEAFTVFVAALLRRSSVENHHVHTIGASDAIEIYTDNNEIVNDTTDM